MKRKIMTGIMQEEHRIYVSNKIIRIDSYPRDHVINLPPKGFLGIKSVAIHRDGTIYVANKDGKAVYVMKKENNVLIFSSKQFPLNRPDGVNIDYNTNSLIVSESYSHKIVQIDLSNDNITLITGKPANAPKKAEDGPLDTASFYYPKGAALDSNGNIYVCESSKRVRKINRKEGTVSTILGHQKDDTHSSFQGHLAMHFPLSIQSDSIGNLYVCDRDEFSVLYWDCHSRQYSILIKNGKETPGFVEGPCEDVTLGTVTYIALDPRQKYLYARTKTAIYQIDLASKWVRTILYQSIKDICGFGVDSKGNLWVMELHEVRYLIMCQPLPWKIARLLWIGNKKEQVSDCVLASVPRDIIFEIINAANQME